ncbi:MAG TPA: hypothetical protein P5268_09305 [Candidatus Marinimicrobia bacterium]|nr:hypothetical protein [Candidatus Neomarinimicrobiota bacterium]HRU93211.1 hypothetical protein [Candidatus Neomarinimicrobiota bacterium]
MKVRVLFVVLILTVFSVFLYAESGITASFKTGFPLTGTSFGLKLGPLNPYCGIDIARISGKYESSYTSWDSKYSSSSSGYILYKDYERNSTFEGSAMLFIPHAGLKFYLWKAYLIGEMMICIPNVNGTEKGERIYYESNGEIWDREKWDDKLSKDDKKILKDALDFMGMKLGIGAEYFLNDHVSIGGEFGLRIILNSYTDEEEDEYIDDSRYEYREKWSDDLSAILGVTYTSFSLNFIL